jgi:hypothetical protein
MKRFIEKLAVGLGAAALIILLLGISTGRAQEACAPDNTTTVVFANALSALAEKPADESGKAVHYKGEQAEKALNRLISLTAQRPPEMFDEILVFIPDDLDFGVNLLFAKDGCVKHLMVGFPREGWNAIRDQVEGKSL